MHGLRPTSRARRVCMTKGSTSIDTLGDAWRLQPPPVPRLVDARTDCLVALQEGEVDAYFGHDTFLVGMVDQDPACASFRREMRAALRHRQRARRTSPSCGTSTGCWTGCATTAPWRASTNSGWDRSTPVPASRCPPCRCPSPRGRELEGGVMSARRWTAVAAVTVVLVGLAACSSPSNGAVTRSLGALDRSHHHDGGAVDRDHHGAGARATRAELRARPAPCPPRRSMPSRDRKSAEARGGRRPGHVALGLPRPADGDDRGPRRRHPASDRTGHLRQRPRRRTCSSRR